MANSSDEKKFFDNQKKTLEVWKKFIHGEPLGKHSVPAYIIRGWEQSKEYNIDPSVMHVPYILKKHELEQLQQKNAVLLRAAEAILKMLAASIQDTTYIATLIESSGHILKVVGEAKTMEQAHERYNVPGADRGVKSIGSSALTLAIREKKALLVQGAEHYNRYWHDWRCAAAPILDVHGEPVAAIAISGTLTPHSVHILALVQACAEGISLRMREITLLENEKHLNAMLNAVHNAIPEMAVVVDLAGTITHANNKALEYFDIDLEKKSKSLVSLFGAPDFVRVEKVVHSGKANTLELEVISPQGPQNLLCRFSPIMAADANVYGMMISISKNVELFALMRHASGNYAKYCFDDIKGENVTLKDRIQLAKLAAGSNHRILLSGESGTGKEIFAQSIHNAGPSHNGPFVAISCAAIPRDLIESELFGYVGGAFTGARRNGMIGKMELATDGTLFLDEINSLPLEMQAKLLRALQQMEIVRIGDTKPTRINARIIAATNKNLLEEVRLGCFREDLYFRLNVIEIVIPPLRERKDDIALLAHSFLRRQSFETNKPFNHIASEALERLYKYHWPGNIRELDNVCERALLLSEDGVIELKHLPDFSGQEADVFSSSSATATSPFFPVQHMNIQDNMREIVARTLHEHNGNISQAAKCLGVARTTLYRKMKKYKILTK